jgi:hypothetical protein
VTLSPAAQAVLDAYFTHADLLNREVTHEEMLAAALRAVANEVAPETPESQQGDPLMFMGIWSERRCIRFELLFIAGELEAKP